MTASSRKLQFGVPALLWLMLTLGMTLAYAARLGAADQRLLLPFAAAAVVGGALLGIATRNFADAWFWSLLASMLAYLAVVGDRSPDRTAAYGWAAVAGVCGGLCGVRQPASVAGGALASAVMAAGLMAAGLALAQPSAPRFLAMLNVAEAAVVGAMLRGLVELIEWFESRSGQGRHVIAAWLTVSVILGNVMTSLMGR